MRWSGREEFSEVVNVGINHKKGGHESGRLEENTSHQAGSRIANHQASKDPVGDSRGPAIPSRTTRHATPRRAAQRAVRSDGRMPKLAGRIAASQSRKRIHHTFLIGTWRCQKAVKTPRRPPSFLLCRRQTCTLQTPLGPRPPTTHPAGSCPTCPSPARNETPSPPPARQQ